MRGTSSESRQLVECFADHDTLIHAAAERVVEQAAAAVRARGRFLVALSGGSTPRPLYELLATGPYASRVEWAFVHVFWGDERCVPPDDPASNYRMAREALLDRVPLPPENVHRIHGEDDPVAAASMYEELLRSCIGRERSRAFDLVLLGMGADGHTASLFPGSLALREARRWVVATRGPGPGGWRVTLTPLVLDASEEVLFLVSGASKAERLKEVLDGHSPEPLPAQLIRPTHGVSRWMIDAAAATQLTGVSIEPRSE